MKKLNVDVTTYRPTAANGFFELPSALKDRRTLINVNSDDHKCLLWSILALKLDRVMRNKNKTLRNPSRVSQLKKHISLIKSDGVGFPSTYKV